MSRESEEGANHDRSMLSLGMVKVDERERKEKGVGGMEDESGGKRQGSEENERYNWNILRL